MGSKRFYVDYTQPKLGTKIVQAETWEDAVLYVRREIPDAHIKDVVECLEIDTPVQLDKLSP